MKSEKFIDWEDHFKQGITVLRIKPAEITIQRYSRDSFINLELFEDRYDSICLSERFNVAPKLIDAAIHKANRLFKYYTFKQLPGAVIFLGCK